MDKHTFDDKARPEHDRETEFHDPGNDARVGDSSMDLSDGQLVITRVERQKGKRNVYDIYLNEQYAVTVHQHTLVSFQLLKGKHLEHGELERIRQEDRICEAYERAVRWIGRRPHAGKEIGQKLRQYEFDEDIITEVTSRLQNQGLLDDRSFAEEWIGHRVHSQKKGRRWAIAELKQKGVSAAHIEEAMKAIDPEVEYENALQLARKKWKQTSGDRRTRMHKTAAYLVRRGFPSDLVRKVVQICASNHET